MPTQFPSAAVRWTLEDLINFESLANRKDPSSPNDPDVAAGIPSEVLIGLATHSKTEPEKARRQAFRLWLNAKIRHLDDEQLPGPAVKTALNTARTLLAGLAFVAGISLVLGLIKRPDNIVNVPLFLGATIGVQLLLLILLLLGWLFRRALLGSGTLSLFQSLVRSLVLAIAKRSSPELRERFTEFKKSTATLSPILRWPIISLTQSAAIFFNLGLLIAFIASLLFTDVRFYWESTPTHAADTALHQATSLIAAPWSTWLPAASPTLQQIAATRFEPPSPFPNQPAEAWYPFLIAAILVWGLLPRLVLRTACAVASRRSLARITFTQRHHRELWRKLTAIKVHADPDAPADGAILLNWNGIDLDPAQVRAHTLQQLHLNPVQTLVLGTGPSDTQALQTLDDSLSRNPGDVSALALIAESWNLIPSRFSETHTQLRNTLGKNLPLHILLLGNPTDLTPFTPPTEETLSVWSNFADTLNDPSLHLHPFRQK
jgi:hypothetical protein